ncbi:hypothetical protein [Bacillus sp. CDB3]|uniref:hypothetical protein n=1 Tax=Bacillus sp. CDB3 TaxID=360310 RepID=UPI0009D7C651|nr:hypothetical protein [Bacillus sp. CDB3]OQR53334.1 hypothetical protein CDB3_30500 [Bacillus sp. CDB3]
MCLVGADSKVKPVTAQQIVAIKRMWFFMFREELAISEGFTQSDVRELILKIYNYEESRYGKYYGSI